MDKLETQIGIRGPITSESKPKRVGGIETNPATLPPIPHRQGAGTASIHNHIKDTIWGMSCAC
eukprot:9333305-Pyramimonas_sp.AAC.1